MSRGVPRCDNGNFIFENKIEGGQKRPLVFIIGLMLAYLHRNYFEDLYRECGYAKSSVLYKSVIK